MNKFNRKISLFFITLLIAFNGQSLYPTDKFYVELLENTLQKIKNGQCVHEISISNIQNNALEEMKQLASKITPNDDIFDSFISLILCTFPKDSYFKSSLEIAKEKGENKRATPASQVNLGSMYYQGMGVEINLVKTFEYNKKAAKQGDDVAQFNIGCMYDFGEGVDKDLMKSFKFFKKAAKLGHVTAQFNLAYMYHHGQGVDENLPEAFKWYKKAAEQEHATAQYILGYLYQYGRGVDENLPEAFEWYKKASDQEHATAQFNLGIMYHFRLGVDRDLAQSLKWYLECFKNINVNLDIKSKSKDLLKSLLTFNLTTMMPEDEADLIINQETLKDNIETFLGLHDMEKGVNQPDSPFKECEFAIPILVNLYQDTMDLEVSLLEVIGTYSQPAFMVTCLQPIDVNAFKLSHCPDIKCYEFQDQYFLTFGHDNIMVADKLTDIVNKTHSCYGAISHILNVLTEIYKSFETEIQMSDLSKALKKQYILRLKLNSEETQGLAGYNSLIEKVEQEIEVLKQLQAIPQQLTDLLIEGAPVRNKLFLQNNEHIGDIFKD